MNLTKWRALPWGLWVRQTAAVLRLELGKSFLNRRSWWIFPAAALPVLLTAGHSLAALYHQSSHGVAQDTRIFASIFHLVYLRVFLFFGCALLFTNLFSGEVLARTLHYYFLAPVRREVLLAGKYFSGLAAAAVLFGGSVALAHLALYMHHGALAEEFYIQGLGLRHLVSYAGVTVLACAGYGAVFTVMGLVFRNPMIPAAIVMVWEGIIMFLPPVLKKISVIFYLKSLCPVTVPPAFEVAFLVQEAEPVSPWVAISGLLLLTVAALAYAGYRLRKFEISYAG